MNEVEELTKLLDEFDRMTNRLYELKELCPVSNDSLSSWVRNEILPMVKSAVSDREHGPSSKF